MAPPLGHEVFKFHGLLLVSILAYWCYGSLGDALDGTAKFSDEDCVHNKAEQEDDDASLLQLMISTHEEHQQDKAHNFSRAESNTSQDQLSLTAEPINASGLISSPHKNPEEKDQVIFASVASFFQQNYSRSSDSVSIPLVLLAVCIAGCAGICVIQLTVRGMGRGGGQSPGDIRSQLTAPASQIYRRSPTPTSPKYPTVDNTQSSAPAVGQGAPAPPPTSTTQSTGAYEGGQGMPLCPSLVIPDSTRLACIVRRDVRREKQSIAFDVCSVAQRGRQPLFRVIVSEQNSTPPGIFLKAIDGLESLAFLSTEELWSSPAGSTDPSLNIFRPSSALYGTVQKFNNNGGVIVMRGQTPVLTLSGDFINYDVKAISSAGRVVATATAISAEECQVHVQAKADAGLVLIALFAADKLDARRDASALM